MKYQAIGDRAPRFPFRLWSRAELTLGRTVSVTRL